MAAIRDIIIIMLTLSSILSPIERSNTFIISSMTMISPFYGMQLVNPKATPMSLSKIEFYINSWLSFKDKFKVKDMVKDSLTPTMAKADVCLLLSLGLQALLSANHLGKAPPQCSDISNLGFISVKLTRGSQRFFCTEAEQGYFLEKLLTDL